MPKFVKGDSLDGLRRLIKTVYQKKLKTSKSSRARVPLMVPSFDHEEIIESVESLINANVTMGSKVKLFENEFSKYIGKKHGIMVNSGSSANLLALSLIARKFKRQRPEVITTALTWSTSVFPIYNSGAIPNFVDINLEDFTMDIQSAQTAINDNTTAILAVHLLGSPSDARSLRRIADEESIALIEDSCEAHGSKIGSKFIGSFGDLSTFSFFFSHHISTIEGGIILTDDDQFNRDLRSMRAHGWIRERDDREKIIDENNNLDPRFLFVIPGYNLRPTEIQGAFGIHQVKKLERFVEIRNKNASYLSDELSKFSDIIMTHKNRRKIRHAWFGYPIVIRPSSRIKRKEFTDFLERRGIETRPIMAGDMTQQPVMKHMLFKKQGKLPNTELVHKNGFFIGNHQGMNDKDLEYIVESITTFLSSRK